MKILAIGDLHGKTVWTKVNIEQYNKIIFIGDYLDDWTESDTNIISNFKNIIACKKKYPDKVVLLFGNHETHYCFEEVEKSPGYRDSYSAIAKELLLNNLELFTTSYQVNNYLFTHAGLSQSHLAFLENNPDTTHILRQETTLSDGLNKISHSKFR